MFDGANFDSDATFLGAEFGEDASLERTRFGHSTLFVESRFGDGTWFTDAAFGDRSGFWRSEFFGSASFAGIQVAGSLEFCGKEEDAEFHVFQSQGKCTINFERMNLARPEQVSFRSVSFQRVSFMDTDLSQVLFENTAWPADGAGNKTFPGKIEEGEFKAQSGTDSLTRLDGLCHQLRINYETAKTMPRQESSSGPRWSTGEDGAFFAVRETCARASRRGYPPGS
ncbi:MAG: pentapeptide repeat-containing protein [Nitrospinota bacterium]